MAGCSNSFMYLLYYAYFAEFTILIECSQILYYANCSSSTLPQLLAHFLYYVTDASSQDLRGNDWLVVVIHICEGSGLLRAIVCHSSDEFINFESLSLDWVTLHWVPSIDHIALPISFSSLTGKYIICDVVPF